MPEKLVTVAQFSDSFRAHIAQVRLETSGIKSVIVGENLMTSFPQIGPFRIEIQVLSNDAGKALEILESDEKQEE
jgi:hypothetical protein